MHQIEPRYVRDLLVVLLPSASTVLPLHPAKPDCPLLVLARYFQRTGQIEPGPWSAVFDEVPQDSLGSLDAIAPMGHI